MNGAPQTLVRARFCKCGHLEAWHAKDGEGKHTGPCSHGCGCPGFHSRRSKATSSATSSATPARTISLEHLVGELETIRDVVTSLLEAIAPPVYFGEDRHAKLVKEGLLTPARASLPKKEPKAKADLVVVRVLAALCTHGAASPRELAVRCGYRFGSGHWNNIVSIVRRNEFAAPYSEGKLVVTELGRRFWERAGQPKPEVPYEIWRRKLQPAHMRIVNALCDATSAGLSREEIAAAVGLRASAGHFSNLLSRVTALGLLRREGRRYTLNPLLAEAG